MNERIQELIDKATKHYPATDTSGEFSTFDKAMFANLLVLECIDTILDCSVEYCTRTQISQELREHFGVE